MIRLLFVLLVWAGALRAAESDPAAPPLLLISLDGFRWDYAEKILPADATLPRLRREGVSTRGLIPAFPSNTFPNHYSLITGLYPAHHGIINNSFTDAATGEVFQSNLPRAAANPAWWGGEPIWVTAVKHGRKSAAAFWVGSEAPIQGIRPTYWRPFDYSLPFEKRLDEVAGWLALPAGQRPAVVCFYLEETNGAGHRFGPGSPELAAAVRLVDSRIAAMLTRIRAGGVEPNVVVVSDHGMSPTSRDRVVFLDDFLSREAVTVEADGSVLVLRPAAASEEEILRQLARAPHVRAYRAADLPARFHLPPGPRVAPVWVLPEDGWHISWRSSFDKLRQRYTVNGYLQGDHGYDPALPNMHGCLIASGPAFRRGVELPAMENIHVYNLLCAVLGIPPAPNDGDDRLVKAALAR
jgi:predicted AlkP superfamily pyrophosphatase or phosphodiesterase